MDLWRISISRSETQTCQRPLTAHDEHHSFSLRATAAPCSTPSRSKIAQDPAWTSSLAFRRPSSYRCATVALPPSDSSPEPLRRKNTQSHRARPLRSHACPDSAAAAAAAIAYNTTANAGGTARMVSCHAGRPLNHRPVCLCPLIGRHSTPDIQRLLTSAAFRETRNKAADAPLADGAGDGGE